MNAYHFVCEYILLFLTLNKVRDEISFLKDQKKKLNINKSRVLGNYLFNFKY